MTLVRCRNCGEKVLFGCLPGAGASLLLLPAFVLALGAPFALWPRLGVQALLLPLPVFLAAVLAARYGGWLIAYGLLQFRPCPACGRRQWSFPFTEESEL